MYPELYPGLEGRDRKLKDFALSLGGGFIFMATTVAAVALSSQWLYVAVSGLSLGAVALIFAAYRSRSFLGQVALLFGASGALAAEAGLVGLLFPVPSAGVCAVLTLWGCLVAAKGIQDVESMAALEPFSVKSSTEITIEQQVGGE